MKNVGRMLALVALLGTPSRTTAQCELQSFAPQDAAGFSGFGTALDVDGDWLIVGSSRDDDEGLDAGSAYLFQRGPGGWVEAQRIVPSQHDAGDFFGASVGISGTTALAGTRRQDTSKGAAYVFDFDGVQWVETQRLQPADLIPGAEFGRVLAIDGDRAMIAAPTSNNQTPGTGAVYEFTRSAGLWAQTEKLETTDPNMEFFGTSLVLDGSRMLVATFQLAGAPTGTVFVYEDQSGTWVQTATLAPALETNVFPLDLHGDTALLGDLTVDLNGTNAGAAWLFDFDGTTWSETDLLQPAGITALGYFGSAGSISDTHVAVGAPNDKTAGQLAGAFFLYERSFEPAGNGLASPTKVFSGPPIDGENVGTVLALDGNELISGSGQIQPSGQVHVFSLDDATVAYCTAKVDSAGCLPQIDTAGVPSLTAPGFEVALPTVLNSKNGLLFYGLAPAALPFLGGTLCVQPPLVRTQPQFSAGNPPGQGADCSGSFAFGLSSELQAGILFNAGESGYAQYWYRDPFGSFQAGLSDAIAFSVCP